MTFIKSAAKVILVPALMFAGCDTASKNSSQPVEAIAEGLSVNDEIISLIADKERVVSTRVLTPEGCSACPLIIFSHGANAAYDRYDALLLPLARAGYRVAAPNHTDSEDHPDRAKYSRADWLPTRLEDYSVIAEKYETTFRVAAGHSFGAMIAQIAGGAEMSAPLKIDHAYLPKAVLAYSPPGPIPNYIGPENWSKITVPSLVTTGTKDLVPMMAETWEAHLVSYNAAPPGISFALIYENMDHYMNGAYGRETQSHSIERAQAFNHMVDSSIFFMSNLRTSDTLSSETWGKQNRVFVEAKAKK